jgi:hypothetical protein
MSDECARATRRRQMSTAAKIHAMRKARPPATPPAIAPVCEDLFGFDGADTVRVRIGTTLVLIMSLASSGNHQELTFPKM